MSESLKDQSKAVVDAYYQAGVRGDLPSFGRYLHPDFSVTAPNYLRPWGGTHSGAAFFREQVLEHLHETLNFSKFSYEVLWVKVIRCERPAIPSSTALMRL